MNTPLLAYWMLSRGRRRSANAPPPNGRDWLIALVIVLVAAGAGLLLGWLDTTYWMK